MEPPNMKRSQHTREQHCVLLSVAAEDMDAGVCWAVLPGSLHHHSAHTALLVTLVLLTSGPLW